jgi:hypothetical protein
MNNPAPDPKAMLESAPCQFDRQVYGIELLVELALLARSGNPDARLEAALRCTVDVARIATPVDSRGHWGVGALRIAGAHVNTLGLRAMARAAPNAWQDL